MENLKSFLNNAGLDEKETLIYLSLLQTGPTAIRKIAEITEINRGTTYEVLKKLKTLGLVTYFHQGKHQHFAAEDPKNSTAPTRAASLSMAFLMRFSMI